MVNLAFLWGFGLDEEGGGGGINFVVIWPVYIGTPLLCDQWNRSQAKLKCHLCKETTWLESEFSISGLGFGLYEERGGGALILQWFDWCILAHSNHVMSIIDKA